MNSISNHFLDIWMRLRNLNYSVPFQRCDSHKSAAVGYLWNSAWSFASTYREPCNSSRIQPNQKIKKLVVVKLDYMADWQWNVKHLRGSRSTAIWMWDTERKLISCRYNSWLKRSTRCKSIKGMRHTGNTALRYALSSLAESMTTFESFNEKSRSHWTCNAM